jgi:hypothetical protein
MGIKGRTRRRRNILFSVFFCFVDDHDTHKGGAGGLFLVACSGGFFFFFSTYLSIYILVCNDVTSFFQVLFPDLPRLICFSLFSTARCMVGCIGGFSWTDILCAAVRHWSFWLVFFL